MDIQINICFVCNIIFYIYVLFKIDRDIYVPQRRQEDDQHNITDDVIENTVNLENEAVEEINGARGELVPPQSPTTRSWSEKRKEDGRREGPTMRKKKRKAQDEVIYDGIDENTNSNMKNSDEFPSEVRPEMFKDNRRFNRLTFEKAAQICWEHQQGLEKIKLVEKKKNEQKTDQERSDDSLPLIKIPEGEDNAFDKICEARKLLRPVNKEIKDQMSWMPTSWKEITRNLPLRVYGLDDCIHTKAIELCHNLSSKIEIKQFSPSNLRRSAKSSRQTAFVDNEGS